jgi:ribosomal protein L44E
MPGRPNDQTGRPIRTLREAVTACRDLWVLCRSCGHAEMTDARRLVHTIGRDIALDELALRFRCSRCREQRAALVPHDRHWMTMRY